MCAPDGLHSCLGKSEVLDLALLDQLLHRSCNVFDGHIRIDTMLIEEIDHIGLKAFERSLGNLLDVLWPAVQPCRRTLHRSVGLRRYIEAELGGDHYPIAHGSECLTNQLLVDVRPIDLRRIEE